MQLIRNSVILAINGFLIAFCCLTVGAQTAVQSGDPDWVRYVGAREIKIPALVVNVADYGARGNGTTMNTTAIQQAIDTCAARGGGKVVFPAGAYLTGALFLKSNVELHIGENVKLLGSQSLSDYPEIWTRIAGVEMRWPAALINVSGQKNVALTGNGIIDSQGKPFWDSFQSVREEYQRKKLRWVLDFDVKRPRTLLVDGSWDIMIKDVTFQRAAFWTVHILYSSYVTVDGIKVRNNIGGHGPSTDGIDIDSSSWILVQNADIDCNDDNFCLKSGKDWDGLRINRPTEYVLIQDCIARRGHGLITFGSETSGGIRNVIARNLRAQGTRIGIRFKSAPTRGGVVEDILIQDVKMDTVGVAVQMEADWFSAYSRAVIPDDYADKAIPDHWKALAEPVLPASRGIPTFRQVTIERLRALNSGTAIRASGLEAKPIRDFEWNNVYIEAKTAGSIKNAAAWSFRNSVIRTLDDKPIALTNAVDINGL